MTDENDVPPEQVINAAVGACIDANGVHVTEVTGVGTIIGQVELDEDQRIMLADFVEALRVKREGQH